MGASEAPSIAPHPSTLESTALPSRLRADRRRGHSARFGRAEMKVMRKAILWLLGAVKR